MQKTGYISTLIGAGVFAAIASTAVMSHSETAGMDPDVAARMKVMVQIKDAMGPLGGMAKGQVDFDAAVAQAAVQSIVDASGQIAAVFEAQKSDPKSEALPAIWENWDDFVAKGEDLEFAAESWDVSSLDALRAGMGNVGATCGACHKSYRMKK